MVQPTEMVKLNSGEKDLLYSRGRKNQPFVVLRLVRESGEPKDLSSFSVATHRDFLATRPRHSSTSHS